MAVIVERAVGGQIALYFDSAEQLAILAIHGCSFLGRLLIQELHLVRAGDAEARRILHDAAVDLALAVESVARRLKLHKEPFPLVFAGGGLRPGLLADSVRARLRRTLPAADVLFPPVEPAIGAALLALHHIGEGASSA